MMYSSEQRFGKCFIYFTVIAIFIACLGLFGLASYTAECKTKEIGIRKVLGASGKNVVYLLSREFLKLVILATLISLPIGYFAINKWLQNFAYKTDIGFFTFLLSTVLALTITIFTVGYQTVKAASANPVESLKYE